MDYYLYLIKVYIKLGYPKNSQIIQKVLRCKKISAYISDVRYILPRTDEEGLFKIY